MRAGRTSALRRHPLPLLLLLSLLLLLPLATTGVYDGYRLIKTQILGREQAYALAAADKDWDFWSSPRGGANAVIFASADQSRDVEAVLEILGIAHEEQPWSAPQHNEDQQRTHKRRSIGFDTFYSVDEIHAYLDELALRFPRLASVRSLGSSSQGRPLKLLRVAAPSSGHAAERKPAIFIDATIHAREWIAPAVALYIIHQLVENFEANSALLEDVDWYFLPVVNPDGYAYTFTNERFWRKTRTQTPNSTCIGVDANRNFNFHWEENTGGVCSETFAGLQPFSEPEAVAVAKFLTENKDDLLLYLTLHSYGPYLLTPWGYTANMSEDGDELVALAEKAAAALAAVRGTNYTVGSSANVLYYSYGTSRDYAKGVAGVKYAYTMELPPGGSGFDLPAEDILPVATETFEAMKVFARAVASHRRARL